MSAGGEAFNAENLFLLTLNGQVTVHFMDGYTLEGELIKQDLFNIFLLIDNQPRMISRSQIRYVAGIPGQEIVPDIVSQEAFREVVETDTADVSDAFDTAEVASPLPTGDDEFKPAVMEAGEETLAGEEGTFVVDSATGQPVLDVLAEMSASASEPVDESEDTGVTFVLPDSADLLAEIEQMPEADEWDDATVVLDQEEDGEENEITAVLDQEAGESVTIRLVCSSGPHVGDEFELKGETITLGRAKDNDVSLYLDKEISRRHAVIRLEAGKFVIQDHNSLNGTYVNSERVDAPRILQEGDVIFVGVSDLKYFEEG